MDASRPPWLRQLSRAGPPTIAAIAAVVAGLAAAMLVAASTGLGPHPTILAGDAQANYLLARSLAFDGDVDLCNQYAAFGDRWRHARFVAEDGTCLPTRELGTALSMVPGLWLADLLGRHEWQARLAVLPSATSLGLTCWLAYGIVHMRERADIDARLATRKPVDRSEEPAGERRWGTATLLALAAVLGSPLPYYAAVQPGYPHALDALCSMALLAHLAADRPPWRAGLCVFAAVCVRLSSVAWCVGLIAIAIAARHHEDPRRQRQSIRRAIAGVSGASLAVLVTASPRLLHPPSDGSVLPWGPAFFDPSGLGRGLYAVLVGDRGLWTATPVLAIACVGLVLAARSPHAPRASGSTVPAVPLGDPWLARAAGIVVALVVVALALVPDPGGGDAFGARRTCGLCGAWVVGMIAWAHVGVRLRTAVALLSLVLAAGNLAAVARHRQGPPRAPIDDARLRMREDPRGIAPRASNAHRDDVAGKLT